jgi:hypothetical protein
MHYDLEKNAPPTDKGLCYLPTRSSLDLLILLKSPSSAPANHPPETDVEKGKIDAANLPTSKARQSLCIRT